MLAKHAVCVCTALCAALAFGATGCLAAAPDPPPNTVATAAPSSNIASHRTFAFGLTEMPPAGFNSSPRTFEVQRRVRDLIVAALVQKGYVEDPNNGEILLRFGASNARTPSVEAEVSQTAPGDWGRLQIDAYDAATKLQVWSTVVVTQIDPQRIDDRVVSDAVQQALSSFPARAGATGTIAPPPAAASSAN
jgi:hypothetical protein